MTFRKKVQVWRSDNGAMIKVPGMQLCQIVSVYGSVSLPGLDLDLILSYSIFGPLIVLERVLMKH